MQPRHDAKTIRKVAEIYLIQQRAAEAQVVRAAEIRRELDGRRAEGVARLQDDLEGWIRCTSGPVLNLHVSGAWSAEVASGAAELRQTDGRIRDVDDEKARLADLWRGAIARTDAADILARAAQKRVRRRLEEAVANETIDQFGRRRGSR